MPAGASAATVTVRPDPDTVYFPGQEASYDEVYYVAARGESNRLVISFAGDARSVTVSDPGAVIRPTGSCASVDSHTAVCEKRPEVSVEWLGRTRALLGNRDDRVSTTRQGLAAGSVRAHGGPGDDILTGGDGLDHLDGGGGDDALYGGGSLDVLTDGDRDGASAAAGPGRDILDGGADIDEISYAQRSVGVTVAITGDRPGGGPGEGDVVRGFENVTGGAGDDRLIGDDRSNVLSGGKGADVLVGRRGGAHGNWLYGGSGPDRLRGGGGSDSLVPGTGKDAIVCRSGRDRVSGPERGEPLQPDCEWLGFRLTEEDTLEIPAYPVASTNASVSFRMSCPDLTRLDGEPSSCDGPLILREASGSQPLLGRGRIRDNGTRYSWTVRVRLTDLGRQRARRPRGVLTTISISGRNLPRAAWTIRLTTAH